MRSGKLDQRGTIERPNELRGSSGQAITSPTWVTFATLWFETEPSQAGGEFFGDDKRSNVQRRVFRCRFVEGVTTKMRVNIRGEHYDIKAIEEPDRRRALRLVCEVREKISGGV